MHSEKYLDEEMYERNKASFEKLIPDKQIPDDDLKSMSMRDVPCLNQDVIDWLNENVSDSTDKQMAHQPQGWAMGDTDYRKNDGSGFNLFFLRRRDAMNFIKEWSVHKQPTHYLNYFDDDRRELIDGRLTKVER
jgi:hypothetical protein